MTASLSLRVFNGPTPANSGPVTGMDFLSADNALCSPTNRAAHPLSAGTNSFEKWVALQIDVPPANAVTNFQLWGDGSVDSTTILDYAAGVSGYVAPTASTSVVATTDFATATSGAKALWDSGSYVEVGATTKFAVFQLRVLAGCPPGPRPSRAIYWSWDET